MNKDKLVVVMSVIYSLVGVITLVVLSNDLLFGGKGFFPLAPLFWFASPAFLLMPLNRMSDGTEPSSDRVTKLRRLWLASFLIFYLFSGLLVFGWGR